MVSNGQYPVANRFGVLVFLLAGFDYRLSKSMYLNVDVKKVDIDADLRGAVSTTLKIDPWLVGVGLGWRF